MKNDFAPSMVNVGRLEPELHDIPHSVAIINKNLMWDKIHSIWK